MRLNELQGLKGEERERKKKEKGLILRRCRRWHEMEWEGAEEGGKSACSYHVEA